MIAMALSSNPTLLIADGPISALDVTTQVQILDFLRQLQREYGMASMLITHDLGVIEVELRDKCFQLLRKAFSTRNLKVLQYLSMLTSPVS
jgi:ABC-type dipeptide/oligopeptide/nickel transport system ATPase component